MNKLYKNLSKIFLVALLLVPVFFLLALITAGGMLFVGVTTVLSIVTAISVIFFIPIIFLILFLVVYFSTSKKQKIRVRIPEKPLTDEPDSERSAAKSFDFEFDDKIQVKNIIRVIRLNARDARNNGASYFESWKVGYLNFMEREFKPYWGQKIKVKYGFDAADAFADASLQEIEIEL